MVKGLKKPILDVLREKAPETHRKEGEHLNLSAETPVHKGAFIPGNGWQEVRFANPVKDVISVWKLFLHRPRII